MGAKPILQRINRLRDLERLLQTRELAAGITEARDRSARELLGRAPLQGRQAGLDAAVATVRPVNQLQIYSQFNFQD